MSTHKLDRDSLYEAVWAEPMSHLSPKYGLSDKGLAKICAKMEIPIPYRGYWSKLAAGKPAPQTLLPQATSKTLLTYQFNATVKNIQTSGDELLDTLDLDLTEIRSLQVQEKYPKYHPFVEEARQYFIELPERSAEDIIKPRGKMLQISSSIKNFERALNIVEAVIRAVEQIGGSIILGTHKYSETSFCSYAVVQGEKLAFSIKEHLKNIPHVPTEEEKRSVKKRSWEIIPAHDLVPSNEYELTIEEWTDKKGLQRRWLDKPKKPLEKRIGEFIIGMLKTVPIIRAERQEREERDKKLQEEKERKRLEQEKRESAFKRKAALDAHLQMIDKVTKIDSYIQSLNTIIETEETISTEKKTEILDWIEWVKQYKCSINPLNPENLLFEHEIPQELQLKEVKAENSPYTHFYREEKKKEPSWGWWDRPPWKW